MKIFLQIKKLSVPLHQQITKTYMEELLEHEHEFEEIINRDEIPEKEPEDDLDEELESDIPDVSLAEVLIEKIRRMFDAGSTRSVIAKELNISREDVIEVLSKYVTRNKINGKNTQVIDFKFDATGKTRIPLGDKLNTCIYVKDGDDVEAAKKKWLKILNDNND